jgi:iron complex outermembrane receptor protein
MMLMNLFCKMVPKNCRVLSALVTCAILFAPHLSAAQIKDDVSFSADSLKKLSLEELMNLEVTSVSRREEKLSEVPSAIQVITQEEIRRSGATNIPEALRLAGNIQIGQKNAHDWAISARGFNTDLANKLLVLIDGRTVYTPLFSGVFWDRQDYLLEDIERIEVISGPGGTLWGANAVNGVINIITKKSDDTQGLYAEGDVGTELRYSAALRYGGKIGSNINYRVYGKYFDRDEAVLPDGTDAGDSWKFGQTGLRMDAHPSENNTVTVQGDYYDGDVNVATGGSTDVKGGNILSRWTHLFSEKSEVRLQLYYDKTFLNQPVPATYNDDQTVQLAPAGILQDNTDTYDLDFQHSLQAGVHNQVVWGFGYRHTHDQADNAPGLAFEPPVLDRNLFSVFAQDKIALTNNLALTLGTKVEHNDYTGFEFEPSTQLQFSVASNQTLWASVARAVRMPSRFDRDLRLPTPGFAPVVEELLIGGKDFKSETVLAYEVGYRAQVGSTISSSLSTFYNVYDDVRSTSLSPPNAFGLPFPLFYENNLEGETYGVELTIKWQPIAWWRIHGTYNLFKADIREKPGKDDFNNALNETADPENRFLLRSSMNLLKHLELDAALRWNDSFTYSNAGVPAEVDSYTELQVRVGWHLSEKLELSVTGQNLLHDQHLEYVISGTNPREEIQRSVYGKLALRL